MAHSVRQLRISLTEDMRDEKELTQHVARLAQRFPAVEMLSIRMDEYSPGNPDELLTCSSATVPLLLGGWGLTVFRFTTGCPICDLLPHLPIGLQVWYSCKNRVSSTWQNLVPNNLISKFS